MYTYVHIPIAYAFIYACMHTPYILYCRAEKEVRRRERIASAKGLLSMFKGGKKTREEIEAEEDAKLDEEEVGCMCTCVYVYVYA
jgi:hypothetical protein